MFNHLADDVQDFSVRFNPFKTDNGLRLERVKYKVTVSNLAHQKEQDTILSDQLELISRDA